jgi:superfamily II DNA or RNA helicase
MYKINMPYSNYKPKKRFTTPKKTAKDKERNLKGNWEWTILNKNKNKDNEHVIKRDMSSFGKFDPNKIEALLNPEVAIEIKLYKKNQRGEVLKKSESIILNNFLERKRERVQTDLENLDKYGLNFNPNTNEGKLKKLLIVLSKKMDDEDLVYYIYLKIKENEMYFTEELKKEYESILERTNTIVKKLDKINLQFTKFYGNMPPLNNTEFNNLDDFQVKVIENIKNKTSTLLKAPTSAGKSVLVGNLFTDTKLKVLVVVPTDALVWQMAAYAGNITKKDIPIITNAYQTKTELLEMIKLLKTSNVIVGTPQKIADYLVLDEINKINFDWVVCDEIHMANMHTEIILKRYNESKCLALSATIGNVKELQEWFIKIGYKDMEIIECNKRFFNLQKYYFDNKINKISLINPLSLTDIDLLETYELPNKIINPTPVDIWNFYEILDEEFELDNLLPHNYFGENQRISLDDANKYFDELVFFLNKKSKKEKTKIMKKFKKENLKNQDIKFFELINCLKESKKTPAILFQKDSSKCLQIVRNLAKEIVFKENEEFPNLIKEKLMIMKQNKKINKINDKKDGDIKENKAKKELLDDSKVELENTYVALNEPHEKYVFNNSQYFSKYMVEDWYKNLKMFFPNNGVDYHYIIDLLWRGIGVYVDGLPEPYLRLVQKLAVTGKLAIVFSDISLVFGVSMPFRTSVILHDKDEELNPMLYHQMSGRAGRRGLDKEGNVVFCGFSWNEIKDMNVKNIPRVEGSDKDIFLLNSAYHLNKDIRWNNIFDNFLHKKYQYNQSNIDNYDFIDKKNKNLLHLVWKLREDKDVILIIFLLPYIRKGFANCNPSDEKNQINLTHVLLNFIDIQHCDNSENVLEENEIFKQGELITIKSILESYNIKYYEFNDFELFKAIRKNKIADDNSNLREQLNKFKKLIIPIQHYLYHENEVNLCRLFGKLLTRLWWIYHSSSPIMRSINEF